MAFTYDKYRAISVCQLCGMDIIHPEDIETVKFDIAEKIVGKKKLTYKLWKDYHTWCAHQMRWED